MGTRGPRYEVVAFARTVVEVAREENVSFMAGALAYYAFISLVPLAALVVFALAVVGSESLAERALALTGSSVSPTVGSFLRQNVFDTRVSGAVSASVVGLVTLVWGAFKLFWGLNTAFSEIYGTTKKESLVDEVVDGLVLLVTVPVALVAVALVTALLSVVTIRSVRFATPLFLTGGLTVVFFPLYYVFPDTDVSVSEVFPGVVFAAVGWMGLQQLFQVYVLVAGVSVGGAIGAVLLFLTWLYFAGVVLLVGCVVNAVHGGYHERQDGGPASEHGRCDDSEHGRGNDSEHGRTGRTPTADDA